MDSKNGYNGTANFTTSVNSAAGKIGLALNFIRSSLNKVTIPNNSFFDYAGNLTVSAWVYPTDPTSYNNTIVEKTPHDSGFELVFDNGNGVYARGGGTTLLRDSTNYPNNKWYHIVLTISGSTATIYVNGIQTAQGPVSPLYANGGNLIIGGTSLNNYNFNGYIDDVRIYNRALSSNEILQINNGGAGTEAE